MEVTFAVYEDKHFTMQTPFGSRTVIQHIKVSEHIVDVPEKIAEEVNKHYIFNADKYCEGIGAVPVQDQDGNVYPQTVKFLFAQDICEARAAFERFDEFLQGHIEELEERQKQEQSTIATASESDLQMLDQLRGQAAQQGSGQGNIIIE